jgi:hypothetical protein
MNKHLVCGLIGLLNIMAFLLHYWSFKKSRKVRKSWAAGTIGAGLGPSIFPFVELLYGLETDVLIIAIGASISISGIAMFLLNRFDRRFSSPI